MGKQETGRSRNRTYIYLLRLVEPHIQIHSERATCRLNFFLLNLYLTFTENEMTIRNVNAEFYVL